MKTQKIDVSKVRITKKEQQKVEAALAVLAKLGATPSRKVLHVVKMANRFRLDRGMITRIEDQLTIDGAADVVVNRKQDDVIVFSRETLAKKQEHGKKLGSGAFKKKVGGLAGMSPEKRREAGRKGGIAAAKKRAEKAAMRKARGPHWTQKPENRAKVLDLTRKAAAARESKKAAA